MLKRLLARLARRPDPARALAARLAAPAKGLGPEALALAARLRANAG